MSRKKKEVFCQVVGCPAELSSQSQYCQKKKCCTAHLRAPAVELNGIKGLWRFCQQCGKMEPVSCFQGTRRSCSAALLKRRKLEADKNESRRRPLGPSHICSPSNSSNGGGCGGGAESMGAEAAAGEEQAQELQERQRGAFYCTDTPELPATPDYCEQAEQLQLQKQQQQQQPPPPPQQQQQEYIGSQAMETEQQPAAVAAGATVAGPSCPQTPPHVAASPQPAAADLLGAAHRAAAGEQHDTAAAGVGHAMSAAGTEQQQAGTPCSQAAEDAAIDVELEQLIEQALREAAASATAGTAAGGAACGSWSVFGEPSADTHMPVCTPSASPAPAMPQHQSRYLAPGMAAAAQTGAVKVWINQQQQLYQQQYQQGSEASPGLSAVPPFPQSSGATAAETQRAPEAFLLRLHWLQQEYATLQHTLSELHATVRHLMS